MWFLAICRNTTTNNQKSMIMFPQQKTVYVFLGEIEEAALNEGNEIINEEYYNQMIQPRKKLNILGRNSL